MRRCITVVPLICCLAGVPTSSVLAQDAAQPQGESKPSLETAVKDIASSYKRQAQRDPLVRSGLTLPEPQVTLETTNGKGRATGTVGLVKQHVNGETTLGLAISSPIGEAEDAEARPVDLRGLTEGATVTLSVSGSTLFKSFGNQDVINVCRRSNIPTEMCTAGKLEDVDPQKSQELLNLAFRSLPILYGGSFTYGRNTFRFFDTSGAKQDPVRGDSFQAQGSIGFLVNGRRDLLAFQMAYSRVFSSSTNKTQFCRPLSGSTVSRCDAATIGGPTEERGVIGTIEYRWQKRGESKLPLAFAPTFQFARGLDGADDLTSIEAPFYFFQEKPKASAAAPKLNGGVAAGWRSDSGFQVAVFIGTTFSLFKL